jgi:hypothetical protein
MDTKRMSSMSNTAGKSACGRGVGNAAIEADRHDEESQACDDDEAAAAAVVELLLAEIDGGCRERDPPSGMPALSSLWAIVVRRCHHDQRSWNSDGR